MTPPAAHAPCVVAVSGLAREARIAEGPGVRAIAVGGGVRRVAAALEREVGRGACAIMSFGIAGGLADDVAAGACIVARAIVAGRSRRPCDAKWVAALAARIPDALVADVAGVAAPLATPAEKRALRRASGAAAVDTESHVAAEIAAKHGLPFAALRVVADSSARSLPPLASVALSPAGRVRGTAVLGALARRPGQTPLVVRAAVDAARAFRALSRSRRLLGAGLAFPDLDDLLRDVT